MLKKKFRVGHWLVCETGSGSADEALMIVEVELGVRRQVNETSQALACRALTRSDHRTGMTRGTLPARWRLR
jgi:hypothetical protein